MEEEKNYIPTITIIVLFVIIIAFGAFYFGQNSNNNQLQGNQTATETTNQSPSLNNPPQVETQTTQPPEIITTQPKQKTVSEVTADWSPLVGNLKCFWGLNGNYSLIKQGSGTITGMGGDTLGILTNRHVVDDGNGYSPNVCDFWLPNDPNLITSLNTNVNSSITYGSNGYDYAGIKINNPDDYIKSMKTAIHERLNGKTGYCYKDYPNDILLGDELIVLGYPAIGSAASQTFVLKLTHGYISGNDGDYYLTDAKIEEGNSGGLAVLIKHDCFIGIPTFKTFPGPTGETLGGILKAEAIK